MQHEPLKMPPIEFPIEFWYIVSLVVTAGMAKVLIELAVSLCSMARVCRRRRDKIW